MTVCLGVPKCHTSKRDKEATKEKERHVHDNRTAPAGLVLSLEHRACGALQKSDTSRPVTGRLVYAAKHGRTRVSTCGAGVRGK